VSTKLIAASEVEGRVCEAFLEGCDEPEQVLVYRIERLRLADDQPVAQQIIFLRASDFGPKLLEEEDFSGSVFKIYDRYYRRAAWADEIIRARRPTELEAERLQMKETHPHDRLVFIRDRITYDDENLPLEVLASVERADFFESYQYHLLADE
jgi:DNA-binding GntR family transcriptional regulator